MDKLGARNLVNSGKCVELPVPTRYDSLDLSPRRKPFERTDRATRLVGMAEPVQTSNGPDKNVGNGPPSGNGRGWDPKTILAYVGRLGEEHKMLLALKGHLYGGSWDPMLDDLRHRLAGKPYIFKLVHRIQDDIERIEEMQKFETEHKIDLAEYCQGDV